MSEQNKNNIRYCEKRLPIRPKKSYVSAYDDARCVEALLFLGAGVEIVVVSDDDCPPTPLLVLLRVMRDKWLAGDKDGAAELARAAAPYIHPRQSQNSGLAEKIKEVYRLNDIELTGRMALLAGGERASSTDPDIPR
jgi:hypothetical protein